MDFFINTTYPLTLELVEKSIFSTNNNITSLNITQLDYENYNAMVLFIKNNDVNKVFTSFIDKYADIHNIKHNIFIAKLITLYLCGGICINSNIRICNLEAIIDIYNSYDFAIIQSCLSSTFFDGMITCKKENPTILSIIMNYIQSDIIDLNDALKCISNPLLLQEYIVANESHITYDKLAKEGKNAIIATHFIGAQLCLERISIPHKIQNIDYAKIGVTIDVPENLLSFYSNGIKQNCLYLYELLNNIGYDVYLILHTDKHKSVIDNIEFYKYKYVVMNEIFTYDFDLIFSIGFSFPTNISTCIKNTGIKFVYYMCGNNYLIDSEKILYSQHPSRKINYDKENIYDQIWLIPQMYNQNKHYCEILFKTECIQVPFIWSDNSIRFIQTIMKLDNSDALLYKEKEGKIGIFEPNISVMKWALPSILIAEKTYRKYKNISHVYITNADKKNNDISSFNKEAFNDMVRPLDLFKDKKLSSEGRFVTLELMSKHCDIAISHQWENPLNYLYFDLAWMGYPILHNAYLCKDVGYYYDGFNYEEGSELLNDILINHNANKLTYLKKNREIISQYLPSNKILQSKYKQLITNILT